MLGHGQTDYLLSPIRIIVRMPEPDCFLRYRMRCNAEFYYVGKIPCIGIGRPSLQRGVVLKWFYSPRAVGTPLSEVYALYRVPFYFFFFLLLLLSRSRQREQLSASVLSICSSVCFSVCLSVCLPPK